MLQNRNEEEHMSEVYREAETHLQKLFRMKEFYTRKMKDFTEGRSSVALLRTGSRYQTRTPKNAQLTGSYGMRLGSPAAEHVHVIPSPHSRPVSVRADDRVHQHQLHRPQT